MPDSTQLATARQAFLAIDRGDTLHGLLTLECSPALRGVPVVDSYLAYCMARERGEIRGAVRLCQAALTAEPQNPAHYLNLGRIYLVAQDKAKAIATFWKGVSRNPATASGAPPAFVRGNETREQALIMQELRRLGIRKRVVFSRLHRGHPFNIMAGRLLSAIGMR